ncbi:Phage regulatory protein Rha [Parageobacillus caldoxylosilyticus]|uniref:Rha family transcriptional regulator n=1 Tax=Saccharococcus caldoxylosilyticus TaxID=81408 RepID=UPI001C4E234F|nr:Rha family transcriptional regulator [Parageobacillus caldoxylosilyticus]QXJ39545.1 Phage regulatory protein Rha [Parageobacillus caldoxylosilyticus]
MNKQLVFIDNNRVVTDSLTVAECFGKRHDHVLRDIEVQLEKLIEAGEAEWGLLNFGETRYQHPQNKQWYKKYLLTEEAFTLVAFAYTTPEAMKMKVRFIEEFKRMKEELQKRQQPLQPKTQAEMLLLYAQQMVEQERRMKQIEEQVTVVQHRLDNIDRIDTIGDLRQRLNKMIQKYARQNGIPFNYAWKDFVQAFNTAYRTNLELRRQNYINKTGKDVSRPQFLEEMGLLEDAIRVADKMLNREAIAQ